MTILLGVTLGRCSGCSIFIDDKIEFATSEERYTGKKSDESYPINSINDALRFCDLQAKDIDRVLIAGNQIQLIPPLIRVYSDFSVKDHLRMMSEYWYPRLVKNQPTKMVEIFKSRISTERYPFNSNSVKQLNFSEIEHPTTKENDKKISDFYKHSISVHLNIDESKIIHIEHDACHAAYALYGSPIRDDNTLIVTADAWGDDLSATIALFNKRENSIKRVKEYSHKDFQLARIYRYTTLLLRMIPNEHEYKVMGLAPYHTGTAMKEVESVFDNMQSLDGLEFKFDSSIKDIFDHLSRNLRDYRFDQIAAGLQSFTEKMLVKWFQNAVEYYNVESVVFSGGVSLNVKANSSIAKLSKIKKFFVCGGGGDESIHMGACYTYAESLGIQPKPLENLYLGPNASYDDNDLKIFEKHNITKFDNVDQILEKILAGKIIATCIGRMEMGPRALCNRSILADPRHTKNVQIINKMIKSRDFWMPFAPVILSEYQDELIENPKNIDAPHMTVAFNTIKGIDKIPAAIHQYDHTARAQLLKKEVNPLVWELIKKFHTKTGVPSLLNTSFNLHGYPLVNTIQDAAYVFENSGLEILWLDRHIIEKNSAIIQ